MAARQTSATRAASHSGALPPLTNPQESDFEKFVDRFGMATGLNRGDVNVAITQPRKVECGLSDSISRQSHLSDDSLLRESGLSVIFTGRIGCVWPEAADGLVGVGGMMRRRVCPMRPLCGWRWGLSHPGAANEPRRSQ